MKLDRTLCLAAVLVSAGACSKAEVSYTVNGHTLRVKDSGYVTTAERYCGAAAPGQLKLTFVDYDPICGAPIAPDAPGGARDPNIPHEELELLFVTTDHGDPKLPYEVSSPDCNAGPAGPGIAYFRHYAIGAKTPEVVTASGGEMFLTYLDPTDKQPAKGSFSLDFGTGVHVAGEFETYTCN